VHLLVLAALTDATGNAITARRLAGHLAAAHRVTLVDATTATGPALRALVEREGIDAALGVHALLAGAFLPGLGVPYALVFGGTDLYEPVHELQQRQMAAAVARAVELVAFSAENQGRAEWMWPAATGRVRLVPQAVTGPPPETGFSLRARLGLSASDVLAVLPTGIRRVKDPVHAVDALAVWHALDPRVHLAVVGAVLEPDYAAEALDVLSERAGIYYVSALPRARLLAAIAEADVVLNTSLSEGMCGTLLEAMHAGTAVVARRNAGNESLVVHGHTGLLYDAPAELVHWIGALHASRELKERLVRAARAYVESAHGVEREAQAYLGLAEGLAASRAAPASAPHASARTDELAAVGPLAARLGLAPAIGAALEALVARVRREPALAALRRELSGLLATAPPSVAMAAVRRAALDELLGREAARTFNLLLALLQVPAAEARHAARAIAPEVTRATLADLALWAHQLLEQEHVPGVALEALAWAQRYLRGELLAVGVLLFDLRPFAGPLRAYRHRTTGQVVAESLDGRDLDLASGLTREQRAPARDPAEWRLALEPGSPILELWIPVNSPVTMAALVESVRAALALFARLAPETQPLAVCGESWRLDPQLLPHLEAGFGNHDLQRICHFFPSALSEAKTIRRLFGPNVEREHLPGFARARLTGPQRAVADFLADPEASLRPRSGFVLRDEVEAMTGGAP
jgi:hypothetical protein